jgi:hypothetical protein
MTHQAPSLLYLSEAYMKPTNPFWFYQLGSIIHPLTEITGVQELGRASWKFFLAKAWLAAVLQSTRDSLYPFNVCQGAASELHALLTKYIPDEGQPDNSMVLGIFEIGEITRLAKEFETVFSAEVAGFHLYSITAKLAYDTRTLVANAERLLPDSILASLPLETIADLREAGKCVAYEVPTAAGFHIIRATESVIRQYYFLVVGTLPKVKDRNWGSYIRVLKAKGGDEKILAYIDHIRTHYRNPVSHPEQRLDSSQAQVLLGVCVTAIIQLVGACWRASQASLELTPVSDVPVQ